MLELLYRKDVGKDHDEHREGQWGRWKDTEHVERKAMSMLRQDKFEKCLSKNRKFRLKVKWGKKDGLPSRMPERKSKLSQDVLDYILKDVPRGNLSFLGKISSKFEILKKNWKFCCIWTKSAFLKTFCLVRLWIPLSPQRALSTAFLDLFFVTLCDSMPNRFMWFFWFVLHVLQKERHFFYFASFAILNSNLMSLAWEECTN